jgi:hypothetical protein
MSLSGFPQTCMPGKQPCTCTDPVHPGDNENCPVHGEGYQAGAASGFASAARQGPDFCLSILMSTHDGKTGDVIIVKFGEKGYYTTTYGRQTREWVNDRNERMGVDQVTAAAFELCSVFGNWVNYESVLARVQAAFSRKAER